MSVTDAPTARVAPPTGWYPDPTGAGGTRFWDGSGWTDRTRSSEPNPLPAVAAPPAAPRAPASPSVVPLPAPASRPRNWVAFLVVIAIVLFAAAGAVHVAGGTGGGSGDPNRFSKDAGQPAAANAETPAQPDGLCGGTNRPSAGAIVTMLRDHGLPVAPSATESSPPPPKAPLCSEIDFDDSRGGRAKAFAFVSDAEVNRAIGSVLVGSGIAIAGRQVLLVLPPQLAPEAPSYRAALDDIDQNIP